VLGLRHEWAGSANVEIGIPSSSAPITTVPAGLSLFFRSQPRCAGKAY